MCNNDLLTEFFIWEEKNYTIPPTKSEQPSKQHKNDSISVIESVLPKKDLTDTTATKKCSKCGVEKSFTDFHKCKREKSGIHSACKECIKQWCKFNKNKKKEYDSLNYQNNKEKIIKNNSQYNKNNKVKINKRLNKRNKIDIQFRLSNNLRARIREALKNNQKAGSAVRDLGCSIEQFKEYIASKFANGMTWDNYGEWHLDHIKPLATYNLSDRQQFLEACHYTNYQPLWAKDNLSKGARIIS
mgnify:FL=1